MCSNITNTMCACRNNALNKHAAGYKASNNLISLQDLERLMPRGWRLDSDFYPYVNSQICSALAAHVAGGDLPRRGYQLFGIDLMLVKPDSPSKAPGIYLLVISHLSFPSVAAAATSASVAAAPVPPLLLFCSLCCLVILHLCCHSRLCCSLRCFLIRPGS